MAAQLGIGVRVWIEWCPDERVGGWFDGRCKTGTIVGGPFMPGQFVVDRYTGRRVRLRGVFARWNVQLDRDAEVSAAETMLHPIDDGDAVTERSASRPTETA